MKFTRQNREKIDKSTTSYSSRRAFNTDVKLQVKLCYSNKVLSLRFQTKQHRRTNFITPCSTFYNITNSVVLGGHQKRVPLLKYSLRYSYKSLIILNSSYFFFIGVIRSKFIFNAASSRNTYTDCFPEAYWSFESSAAV